jgi:hypothetical protein
MLTVCCQNYIQTKTRESHRLGNPHGSQVWIAKSPPTTNPHPWRGLPKPAAGCLSCHRGGHGFPLFDISNIHLSIWVIATHGNMSLLQVTTILLQLNACQLWERINNSHKLQSTKFVASRHAFRILMHLLTQCFPEWLTNLSPFSLSHVTSPCLFSQVAASQVGMTLPRIIKSPPHPSRPSPGNLRPHSPHLFLCVAHRVAWFSFSSAAMFNIFSGRVLQSLTAAAASCHTDSSRPHGPRPFRPFL